MANNNPFNSNNYDLGVGDVYGFDRDQATENIIRNTYTHYPKCFSCTADSPQYRILPKDNQYNTAELQKGLYVCYHCIQQGILDPKKYGLREMQ